MEKNEKLLEMACGHFLCDQDEMTLLEAYNKLQEALDKDQYCHTVDEVIVWGAMEGEPIESLLDVIDTLYDDFYRVMSNPEEYK